MMMMIFVIGCNVFMMMKKSQRFVHLVSPQSLCRQILTSVSFVKRKKENVVNAMFIVTFSLHHHLPRQNNGSVLHTNTTEQQNIGVCSNNDKL